MNSSADTPKLRKVAADSAEQMARRCERESFEIPVCPRSGSNPDRRGDLRSGDGWRVKTGSEGATEISRGRSPW